MRRLLLLATVAAAAIVVLPGSTPAHACGGFTGIGPGSTGTVYVVDDGNVVDWIYVETNNVAGLQRGDDGAVVDPLSNSDTCAGPDGPADSKLY